jgi:outer membrane lipoprotein-sorting protein
MRQWGPQAALTLAVLVGSGCAVRRTTTVAPSQVPRPALDATLPDLLARLHSQSEKIQTLNATVELQPTAGSVYSGVIKEYQSVKAFILAQPPGMIRVLGEAPVVGTNIFDMASDGHQFQVYIPSRQKFIVGNTAVTHPAKNALENLRPQHILEALFIPAINSGEDKVSFEEEESPPGQFYVVTELRPGNQEGEFFPVRRIWFDRADLRVARLQVFGPGGANREDVRYSHYRDFNGIEYPSEIDLRRPVEDYRLRISIQKATFNQPIEPQKFQLEKPKNAQEVKLSARHLGEAGHGI